MNDFLNVREIMSEPVEVPEPKFIMKKAPDRQAASHRAFLAEDLLRKWYDELNADSCDTREMPDELLKMYQMACDTIVDIIKYEEKLSRR